MFNEEDFEEIKDWIIRDEYESYYILPHKTKNELYHILNDGNIRFIEVLTLYDEEKVIMPKDRIILIKDGELKR